MASRKHLLHGAMEAVQFLRGEPGGHAARPDLGAEEALVGIDVADAVQQILVEQRRLDGGAAAVEELAEVGFRDAQGFLPGPVKPAGPRLFGVLRDMQAHAAEAAGVHEAQLAPGAQHRDAMGVGRAGHSGSATTRRPVMPRCTIHWTGSRSASGAKSKTMCLPTRWTRSMVRPVSALAIAAGDVFMGSRLLENQTSSMRSPRDALVDAIGYGFDFGEFGHGSNQGFGMSARMLCPGTSAVYHQLWRQDEIRTSYRCRNRSVRCDAGSVSPQLARTAH